MKLWEPENIVAQTLVFAQRPGRPWWPAIVGRCPSTNDYKDREDQVWAFFFGSVHSAWIPVVDMRPYCEETKECMPEINAFCPSYYTYKGRVMQACTLADEFEKTKGTGRPTSEYCGSLIGAAIDMPHLPRWRLGGPRASFSPTPSADCAPLSKETESPPGITGRASSADDSPEGSDDLEGFEVRPPRKRRKSSRTQYADEILDPAAVNLKNAVKDLMRIPEVFVELYGRDEAKIITAVERMLAKERAGTKDGDSAWEA